MFIHKILKEMCLRNIPLCILIFLIFFSCGRKGKNYRKIEGNWLSTMEVKNDIKHVELSTFFQLDGGSGMLNNLGRNSINFIYKIENNNILLSTKSGHKIGELNIIDHSEERLVVRNSQNDTIKFRRLFSFDASKDKLQEKVINQTFRIRPDLNIFPEYYHFNKNKMVLISEINKRPLPIQYYDFVIDDLAFHNIGGVPFIKLLDFREHENYPIFGLVSDINENGFTFEIDINNKIQLIEFERVEDLEVNLEKLIGVWGDTGKSPELSLQINHQFILKRNEEKLTGTWSIDNSKRLITLKGDHGFVDFVTINKKLDAIFIQQSKTMKTSLFKK